MTVLKKSAPILSILFTKQILGTPYLSACMHIHASWLDTTQAKFSRAQRRRGRGAKHAKWVPNGMCNMRSVCEHLYAPQCAFMHGAVHSSTMRLERSLSICKTACGTHVRQGREEREAGGGGCYLAPDSLRLRLYSSNGIKKSHGSIQNTQGTLHLEAVCVFASMTPFHATIQCGVVEIV